ncbi:MAG: thioredoxin domain-containing protein, partial [Dehalococcoidia bacterium]|nr:thioredoxin domain-containing protein [Dehalococcoidia bacterium]
RVYMRFVQATTGGGGWPMSVWLTPALKPFYGGTYFPPFARWGRPGFVDVLREVARAWSAERDRVAESADGVVARLAAPGGSEVGSGPVPGPALLDTAVEDYQQTFDARWGGFGDAPKFPRPSDLLFLLREYARTGAARPMVDATLTAMAGGGIRDQVGGGFHRYSVDAQWRVPHFEKMLYDQAQLVLAYLEAHQAAGHPGFRDVALETLAYVQHEMTAPAGGFYSAEDADSVPADAVAAGDDHPEKREGAFYVWTVAEIVALFGRDADVVSARYGIAPEGNAPDDPHGEFTRQNILYEARAIDDVARLTGRSVDAVTEILAKARATLHRARAPRPRPHLDDKVLAGWNGLMIAAFARAARVLQADDAVAAPLLSAAQSAARFLRENLWDADRLRLLRRYRDGRAAIDGYSEDYAYVIWGLLELLQADFDPDWLDWAETLQRRQDELFWDDRDAGWFATTGEDASVLLRLKEDYDGAEPAAGSVSVMNLQMLGQLSEDAAASARLERALGRLGADGAPPSRAVPMMLAALSVHHQPRAQVVVVGRREAADTRAMLAALADLYAPGLVVVSAEPGTHQARLAERLPWIEDMAMVDGGATAYLCKNFVCDAPTSDVASVVAALDRRASEVGSV